MSANDEGREEHECSQSCAIVPCWKVLDRIDARLEADTRGIYIASKTKHAEKWRALRAEGCSIKASWLDRPADDPDIDYAALWHTNVEEAMNARALILYAEEGETAKGSLVEMGAALAKGVPVYYVGPVDLLTALRHPNVHHCRSVEGALQRIAEDT